MDSFKEFILDQLSGLNAVRCKKMFGGYGIYYQELFFAIISDDRLYFKTDSIFAKEFQNYGMEPFQPNPKQKLKNYYEVPEEILEDKEILIQWARRSSECNNAKTKKK
jgi:DNA transformation protein